MSEPILLNEGGWAFRVQPASDPQPRGLLIAIHGWTGNETSMGIFTRNLQSAYFTLYPRAPFELPDGGYSWAREAKSVAQEYSEFQSIGGELIQRIRRIQATYQIEHLPVSLMGFSQGAALAMTLSLEPNFSTEKAALLAGFLPAHMPVQPFLHLPAYLIAHGSQDTIVPISHARQLLGFLEKQNARVDYCETDTGHKLGTSCVRSLEKFFLETD